MTTGADVAAEAGWWGAGRRGAGRLAGVGSARQIGALSSRRKLREAVNAGEVRRCRRGLCTLEKYDAHRRRAHELAAVASHLTAAVHWGWKVTWPADRPWVTVRRNRKIAAAVRAEVHLTYADLADHEVVDGVTSPVRTVVDCGDERGGLAGAPLHLAPGHELPGVRAGSARRRGRADRPTCNATSGLARLRLTLAGGARYARSSVRHPPPHRPCGVSQHPPRPCAAGCGSRRGRAAGGR